jgi:hypothetical protein
MIQARSFRDLLVNKTDPDHENKEQKTYHKRPGDDQEKLTVFSFNGIVAGGGPFLNLPFPYRILLKYKNKPNDHDPYTRIQRYSGVLVEFNHGLVDEPPKDDPHQNPCDKGTHPKTPPIMGV